MAEGYIKDYRQELESDIWSMPPLYHRVWQYIKYKVNHAENEIPMNDGTKFKILPGQHLTSYRTIAKGVGWYEGRVWKEPNPKTVKKILEWCEKNLMITQEHGRGNREYTLVTVVKWEVYQSEIERGNAKVTARKQQSNSKVTVRKQLVDINKNDIRMTNNDKNEKKYIYAENVSMTEDEYKELISKYGEEKVKRMIEVLDNYKGSTGRPYVSDFKAIYSWVVAKVNKEQINQGQPLKKPKKDNSFGNYSGQREYDMQKLRKQLLGREDPETNEEGKP